MEKTHTETDQDLVSSAIILSRFEKHNESLPLKLCDICNTPSECEKDYEGRILRLPIACKCKREEAQRFKEQQERDKIQTILSKYRKYSLMDSKFITSTFENWELCADGKDNSNLYNFGLKYCEKWELNVNRSLIIWGKAGNGKTYLSFAIANELHKQNVTVMATSVAQIQKMLQAGYNGSLKADETDVLQAVSQVQLLILDDLGTENKTTWGYEKLYSIIDTRYRSNRPLIITTNLDVDENSNRMSGNKTLKDSLSLVDARNNQWDSSGRIYSRIMEMCTPIEMRGESRRIKKGEKNGRELFKELGL